MINFILYTLILAIFLYLIYYIILRFLNIKLSLMSWHRIIEFIFCCYFINVLNVTGMFEVRLSHFTEIHATPNLLPFINTLKEVFQYGSYVLKQVLLNIVLFIPFGLLIGALKKPFIQITLSAFLISIMIETLQYFNGRFTDIDDILSNTLGAIIGYLIYASYDKTKYFLILKKAAKN